MRGSKFDKQLSNLKTWIRKRDELAAAGGNRASVTLQLTFMSTNIAEIPKVSPPPMIMMTTMLARSHLRAEVVHQR